jgi:hypothetical protein
MKLSCGLMEGLLWEATLQASAVEGSGGRPVVVLSNEEILSSEDAEFGEFSIVEATADERAALAQGGYSLADWRLDPSACAACHGGECEEAGQCRELQHENEKE